MSKPEFLQGWLEKRGDKTFIKVWKLRYFEQKGNVLYYYEDSKGVKDPLGQIALTSVSGVVPLDNGKRVTKVIGIQSEGGRTFNVREPDDDPGKYNYWVETIEAWVKHIAEGGTCSPARTRRNTSVSARPKHESALGKMQGFMKKSSKAVKRGAQSVGTAVQSRIPLSKDTDDHVEIDGISRCGYLVKKGHKRWFALKDSTLYWFDKPLSSVEEITREGAAKGHLEMGMVKVRESEKTNTFALIPYNSKIYDLVALTESDRDAWVENLQFASSNSDKKPSTNRLTVDVDTQDIKGWLKKRPDRGGWRRRYFIMDEDKLIYFKSDRPGDQALGNLGAWEITNVDITYDDGENPTFDVSTAHRIWHLMAEDAEDLERWVQWLAPFWKNKLGRGSTRRFTEAEDGGPRSASFLKATKAKKASQRDASSLADPSNIGATDYLTEEEDYEALMTSLAVDTEEIEAAPKKKDKKKERPPRPKKAVAPPPDDEEDPFASEDPFDELEQEVSQHLAVDLPTATTQQQQQRSDSESDSDSSSSMGLPPVPQPGEDSEDSEDAPLPPPNPEISSSESESSSDEAPPPAKANAKGNSSKGNTASAASSKSSGRKKIKGAKQEGPWLLKDRVMAQFTEDDLWYKAEITEVLQEDELFQVRFTGYGNSQECDETMIQGIPSDELTDGDEISVSMSSEDSEMDEEFQQSETGPNMDKCGLFEAAGKGQLKLLRALLDSPGAPHVDYRKRGEPRGWTALMFAVSGSHAECIQELLARGAFVDRVDARGKTAVHRACTAKGRVPVLKLLLAAGGDLSVACDNGDTPMHLAARAGNFQIVRHLLSTLNKAVARAMVNDHGQDGITPLHLACASNGEGSLAVVGLLIKYGADVNTVDIFGNTPLHSAAAHGAIEHIALLIEKGTKFEMENKKGLTPVGVAITHANADAAWELLMYCSHETTELNDDVVEALAMLQEENDEDDEGSSEEDSLDAEEENEAGRAVSVTSAQNHLASFMHACSKKHWNVARQIIGLWRLGGDYLVSAEYFHHGAMCINASVALANKAFSVGASKMKPSKNHKNTGYSETPAAASFRQVEQQTRLCARLLAKGGPLAFAKQSGLALPEFGKCSGFSDYRAVHFAVSGEAALVIPSSDNSDSLRERIDSAGETGFPDTIVSWIAELFEKSWE